MRLPRKGFQREGLLAIWGSCPPPKRARGNSLYAVRFLDTHRKLRNDATNAMLMRGMLIRFVLRPGSTSSAANRSLRDMGAAPYRWR